MSFQRALTGENSIYATVNLNTNVCANSVSTVYLSATNASFTNITTNTWTTGNVSTPNVIATNGYFSTLNISTLNLSTYTVSTITASNIYTSNLSASYIDVINISTLQTINGSTNLRIQNNGGLIVKDRDTSDPSVIQLNYASTPSIETYGLYLEANKAYGRIGSGENCSLQFYADTVKQLENTSTTGWTFYSSINTSYRVNVSNLSVSNISSTNFNTSFITTFNISSNYISIATTCTSYAYVSALAVWDTYFNLSRDVYGDPYVLATERKGTYQTKPSMVKDGENVSYFVTTFNGGGITPFTVGVSGISTSNITNKGNVSTSTFNSSYSYIWRAYSSELHSEIMNVSGEGGLIYRYGGVTIMNNEYVSNISSTKPIMLNEGFRIDQYMFNVSNGSTALFFDKNNICAKNSCLYVSYVSAVNSNISNISNTNLSTTNVSVTTLTGTTITGSTVNGTTGNFSTFNASTFSLTNLSLTNSSVVNETVSTIATSQLNISKGATNYGQFAYLGGGILALTADGTNSNILSLNIGGNAKLAINSAGVSLYSPIYCSTGNICNMSIQNISGNAISMNTVTGANVSSTNLSVTTIKGSTIAINATTVNSGATLNVSVLNCSSSNIITTLPTSASFSTINSSNISVNSISADDLTVAFGFTVDNEVVNQELTILDTLAFRSGTGAGTLAGTIYRDTSTSYIGLQINDTTKYFGYSFQNSTGSNIATMNVNTSRFSVSNISATNISTTTITATNVSTTTISCSELQSTNTGNSFNLLTNNTGNLNIGGTGSINLNTGSTGKCIMAKNGNYGIEAGINTNVAYTDYRSSNNANDYDVRFISVGGTSVDGQGDMTIYASSYTVNAPTTIATFNSTSTNVSNISVSNMSISTALTLECDRRSTWNTSNLIKCSTQLGSYYGPDIKVSTNKTGGSITYMFAPAPANISLSTVPVGLYLVTANAHFKSTGNFNATITAADIGICYGTTYAFTVANTSGKRISCLTYGNLNTSGTINEYWPCSFSSVFNMSATGNYLGVYQSATASGAPTQGTLYYEITSMTITKIA